MNRKTEAAKLVLETFDAAVLQDIIDNVRELFPHNFFYFVVLSGTNPSWTEKQAVAIATDEPGNPCHRLMDENGEHLLEFEPFETDELVKALNLRLNMSTDTVHQLDRALQKLRVNLSDEF